MMQQKNTPTNANVDLTNIYNQLIEVIYCEFKNESQQIKEILRAVQDLYEGKWLAYSNCQVGYHNFKHCLDVTLLTAQMLAGRNRNNSLKLSAEHNVIAITAALFHDAGYIKDKEDSEGDGGKHLIDHIVRSQEIASFYLEELNWTTKQIDIVINIIKITDFHHEYDLGSLFQDHDMQILANIVASADLIAQIADNNYLTNIHALFDEYQEAYTLVSQDELDKHEIPIYKSATDLLEKTIKYYEDFIVPRLTLFERVDQNLATYFDTKRNPYLDSITTNLSHQILQRKAQWRRIGDILIDLGVVTPLQVSLALERQKELHEKQHTCFDISAFKKRFLHWIEAKHKKKTLGDILIDMGALSPHSLRQGLISQALPKSVVQNLEKEELIIVIQMSMILHGFSHDPWVFEQVLVMTSELIKCIGGSILITTPQGNEMIIAASTTLNKEHFKGKLIPNNKGFAGWVCTHNRAAIINNIETDTRYDETIDRRSNFQPQSIIAVPMHIYGNHIGVLEFFNKADGFTEHDTLITTIIANIIATALGTVLEITNN